METIVVLREISQKTDLFGCFSSMERAMQAVSEEKKKTQARYRIIRAELGVIRPVGGPVNETLI